MAANRSVHGSARASRRRLGEPALALELLDAADSREAAVLAAQLRLMTQIGRRAEAERKLGEEVARQQASLSEDRLRGLEALAEDLALTPPIDHFDASLALPPALLAYLHDQRGVALAGRFHTDDPVGFRVALARRFAEREASLSADQVRFALSELWARRRGRAAASGLEATGRPVAAVGGLARPTARGGSWRGDHGGGSTPRRREARRDGDPARTGDGRRDAALVAAGGAHARRRGGGSPALRHDARRGHARSAAQLRHRDRGHTRTRSPGTKARRAKRPTASDPLAARLEAWREAFREAKRTALVDESIGAFLRTRAKAGFMPVALWRIAFRVAGGDAERGTFDRALEHAWLRGDWQGRRPSVARSRSLPNMPRRWRRAGCRGGRFRPATKILRRERRFSSGSRIPLERRPC